MYDIFKLSKLIGFWLLLVTIALIVCVEARQGKPKAKPAPMDLQVVKSLNLTAYQGRWYQVFASQIPNTTFEKNAFCVCMDYKIMQPASTGAAFMFQNFERCRV
jgi:lipocalin